MKRSLLFILCIGVLKLSASQELKTLKVGILHSKTGVMATSEIPMILSTLFAIEEINRSGGIDGKLIEPVIYDGASDNEEFKKGANYLIDQGITTLFGCWTSSSRKSIVPILEERQAALFYSVQFEGLERSPQVIYLGAPPNQQLLPAVSWAMSHITKQFYVVGSDYIYPKASFQILQDFLPSQGGKILGSRFIPLAVLDVDAIIADIKRLKPPAILNFLNGQVNQKFFQYLESDPELKKIPIFSFSVTEDNIADWRVSLDSHYLCWSYFQNFTTPTNRPFLKSFHETVDPQIIVNDPMETAYCGVYLWANTVKTIGSTDIKKILHFIQGQGFLAPEGIVNVERNNHLYRAIALCQVKAGIQPQLVWKSTQVIKPDPFPLSRSQQEWDILLKRWYQQWGNKWGA